MTLSQLLDIRPGVTAVIGGGGKDHSPADPGRGAGRTASGSCLCTTTKILPFSDLPCARTAAELDELRRGCISCCVPGQTNRERVS